MIRRAPRVTPAQLFEAMRMRQTFVIFLRCYPHAPRTAAELASLYAAEEWSAKRRRGLLP